MKLILGFAGEIASGKGTSAKYIVDEYDASSYRFSTILRDVMQRLYIKETRRNVQKMSTVLRKNFSEDILSCVMYQDLRRDTHGIISIDGIRRVEDMKYLKKMPGFRLIYIEADLRKRYNRIKKWGENVSDMNKTFKEFKKDHEREADIHIKELKKIADYVIENNGTINELGKKIDRILAKNLK